MPRTCLGQANLRSMIADQLKVNVDNSKKTSECDPNVYGQNNSC